MANFDSEEVYRKFQKILALEKEDEAVISRYLQTGKIADLFSEYKTLPLSQEGKEKINALINILSYEGET